MLPARIRVAQNFIQFCRGITEPCCGDEIVKRRDLTGRERSAYDASVETIRAYVIGELELNDTPPAAKAAAETPPATTASAPPAPSGPATEPEDSAPGEDDEAE